MKSGFPFNFLLIFVLLVPSVYAQEICNNGIDDDGDGLIDCYDSQCTTDPNCADFFYGDPPPTCSTSPTNPGFNLSTRWQSGIDVSTRSTMIVGDLDADGIPEVICHYKGINELYVLNGQNGNLKLTINCPAISDFADAIAIADTDDDGLGEIYVVTNDAYLHCFENDGSAKAGFTPTFTGADNESTPSIADFNFDGIPEVYIDNRIFNSITGAFIGAGVGSIGQNPGSNGSPASMSTAADVLSNGFCASCNGLELICGNKVYSVNIATGVVTSIANNLPASLQDGFTSVADMNMDGQLDIVVTSNGTIYVWDPRTGLQLGNTFIIPGTAAGGRANIADYDNDGLPEIGVGGKNIYVVIDVNTSTGTLSQKWAKTIVDNSEHTTGSVFDFDCDGKAQVVYRDENNLYVWDGETGNIQALIQCGSATRSELPTIVDVDGDGQVNIVCACSSTDAGQYGKVRAFNSSTNQWVNSRKVMNQHGYSVVNINDDLSVPQHQQNSASLPKVFGFLAQSPIYDVNWNSTCILLADVNITVDTVINCLKDDTILVELTICNQGSNIATAPINISVYNGNPLAGGTLVTEVPVLFSIQNGNCINATVQFPFTGTQATFYLYVNDNGSNPPNAPVRNFAECNYLNNANSILVNMLVFDVPDGEFCIGQPALLDPGPVGDSYLWSTGDTTESIIATLPGTYTLQVTKGNCTKTRNIELIDFSFDPAPDTSVVCPNVTVFHAGPGSNYLWSDGDTTESTIISDTLTVGYQKLVGYCLVNDTIVVRYLPRPAGLFIPNSFTPNGDELNEIYYLVGAADEEFELMIFDRWGQMIFYTNDASQGWDGKDGSGTKVPLGTYAWKLIYKSYCIAPTETIFGVVNVIR
jgi:gliding motility-associated-like protein